MRILVCSSGSFAEPARQSHTGPNPLGFRADPKNDQERLADGRRIRIEAMHLIRSLDRLHAHKSVTCLVHDGGCGAAAWAAEWAEMHSIPTMKFAADCYPNGRDKPRDANAGRCRDQLMLEDGKPDWVVFFGGAFPNVLRLAMAAGVKAWRPILGEVPAE